MTSRDDFKSFIPANKSIPELTLKAIGVGVFLAIVLGAANAYLGLYAGMTVSAVIPGAVMAFAFLRPLKGTILEVNIGMMGAAAGEALAAGVIFTIPALVVLYRLGLPGWETIEYVPTTIIALIGGILGVLWMVPLRRALVIKTDLPFPEGVAVAAVLTTTVSEGKTSAKKGGEVSAIWLLIGALVAALFKFGQLSLHVFRGVIEGVVNIGRYAIGGVEREGWIYGGTAASPALLAVGWIIGPKISSYILVGGLIGWVIITPLIVLVSGLPVGFTPLDGFFEIWGNQIRYIGVGAMLTGGLWTIWKLRNNLASGIREAIIGIKGGEVEAKKRTDNDLNFKWVFLAIFGLTIPIFIVYLWLSNLIAISAFMAIFAVLFAFLASAIAGYMAAFLGSSNNPISGVTVSVLLVTSLILFASGIGINGIVIAILIASVICCAAAISGDVLQSMACGLMIGATPRKQQLMELIGVIAAAPVLAFVVQMLDQAFEIGSKQLVAPQAFLMAGIVKGILGEEMLWPYVLAGVVLALVLILIDLPVLPVAIGIYLPFTLSIPIFGGGVIRHFTDKFISRKYGTTSE